MWIVRQAVDRGAELEKPVHIDDSDYMLSRHAKHGLACVGGWVGGWVGESVGGRIDWRVGGRMDGCRIMGVHTHMERLTTR